MDDITVFNSESICPYITYYVASFQVQFRHIPADAEQLITVFT